jgi:tRNA(Ile)-lysidine synthetase-like protein
LRRIACKKQLHRRSIGEWERPVGVFLWYNPRVNTHKRPSSSATASELLIDQIGHNLQRRCAIARGTPAQPQPLVLGVSGGADSMALLITLAAAAGPGYALHIAHFDHGLRPESGVDAAFVAAAAKDLGLPFHLARAEMGTLAAAGGNLEERARRARYAFLIETALNVTPRDRVPVILTGHHATDQAETVLLHLVRGSGTTGLGGMAWMTRLDPATFDAGPNLQPVNLRPVVLARPLLDVAPERLRAALREVGMGWREDPTNTDESLMRNQLRHVILPALGALNPQIVPALGRTAEILRDDAARLVELDAALLNALLLDLDPAQRLVLDMTALLTHDRSAQRGVLRQALARLCGSVQDVSFELVEGVLAAVAAHPHAGGPHSLHGKLAWSVANAASIIPLGAGDGAAPQAQARPGGRLALSIHRRDEQPFAQRAPQLSPLDPPRPVTADAPIRIGAWVLQARGYARHGLPADWRTGRRPWRAFFDAASAGRPHLVALGAKPGLAFAPLGMGGNEKRIGDLMTDEKVPVPQRAGWPLIVDMAGERVLWVCGVRPGHWARITEKTTDVLELAWERIAANASAGGHQEK